MVTDRDTTNQCINICTILINLTCTAMKKVLLEDSIFLATGHFLGVGKAKYMETYNIHGCKMSS